jgi:hypothetical protein
LPGSYFGSKAEQSSWQRQSFPLSVQAALPAAPRAPPFAWIRHGSFLSSLGSLPATTFSTPLSSTPSGLSQSLGALGEHSASRAPGASRTLASTLGSPLTAEVLSGSYRWGRASREIPHNHSKPPEADPESSGDIERRALSKQAEFSGRSSEIPTSFLSSPSTFKLSKEATSARGHSLHHVPHRQVHTSTAESEAAPSEHSQMDPPFLYRASTARPREVEVQQNRFGGHDRDVRGMHVQTKTAEPGQEAEWLFGSAGYAGAHWTRSAVWTCVSWTGCIQLVRMLNRFDAYDWRGILQSFASCLNCEALLRADRWICRISKRCRLESSCTACGEDAKNPLVAEPLNQIHHEPRLQTLVSCGTEVADAVQSPPVDAGLRT